MTGRRVTAIISAYYAEDYIQGRLENLVGQTEKVDIIAVVQKGSIESGICARFPQVEIIQTNDIPGVYEAWNIGIKAANTPYVTNANSDDRLAPHGVALRRRGARAVLPCQQILRATDGAAGRPAADGGRGVPKP